MLSKTRAKIPVLHRIEHAVSSAVLHTLTPPESSVLGFRMVCSCRFTFPIRFPRPWLTVIGINVTPIASRTEHGQDYIRG